MSAKYSGGGPSGNGQRSGWPERVQTSRYFYRTKWVVKYGSNRLGRTEHL